MQVIVNLPEDTYRRAKRLAQLTRRELGEVLADTLALSLPTLAEGKVTSVQDMSDEQVLSLAKLRLSDEDDQRLSDLLDGQQADDLSVDERSELSRLMQRYQEGLLLKSEALAEAVARKLIPPLAL
ncbi:MAG: hypothetical protein IPH95_20100 [Candidatus Promineofilum sp.]|nr:hypothetical protein [Promineifilum sp.]